MHFLAAIKILNYKYDFSLALAKKIEKKFRRVVHLAKSLIFAKSALDQPKFNFFHFFCLKSLLKNPVRPLECKNWQKN